jgi:hypothetical protein
MAGTAAPVYGNQGNRWWVGLNVGSDQSTVFGTGSILSPNGYESLPSGNAADDKQFAAAAAKNKGAAKPVTISVEHVDWFNINGPYPTQAKANAAIPAIQKAHPAPGEVQQVTGGGQQNAANGAGISLANVETFFADLASQGTWIRVAKVVVGSVMIIVGLLKITGADKAVTTAAKGAALL